jgi:hypothetical protein
MKFSETDINMLEFLIDNMDNIFAIFGGRVFQQTVSIHGKFSFVVKFCSYPSFTVNFEVHVKV